ncbi:hypothetical protein Pst134EB_006267 [Puccinia striiformis f. sp. tritici]|nr:hypothetical protein Pst134EB_006267 [Puccinia striiformis f. sp. tritici]
MHDGQKTRMTNNFERSSSVVGRSAQDGSFCQHPMKMNKEESIGVSSGYPGQPQEDSNADDESDQLRGHPACDRDLVCEGFDPHTHKLQSRNSPSPFSARSSSTYSNQKFIHSTFFDPSSYSHHHHHDQQPQVQHDSQHYPFDHSVLSSSDQYQHRHHHHHHQSNATFLNEFDDPTHQISNTLDSTNPYSVTNSPDQLMFIMPSFAKGSSNQLSLDGPSYAEPMLTSPYSDDSHRFFSVDPTYPPPTTTANSIGLHSDSFQATNKQTESNSSRTNSKSSINTSFAGSNAITPPTTSSSRHASELNVDETINTSDSTHPPYPQSPDPKHGFSLHFKPPENPYSQTGFDLVGALARVVDRPDPKVKIGAVDTSAALVVVDARQNDLPIIFATPSFSILTGYETHEIIGQNCRFLQKPFDSNSVKKSKDQAVNCRATLQIRSHIKACREIQSSIINYRKDGRAFINLVTVIPIAWNSSEISHFVGFQADIGALTNGLGIPPSPKTRPNLLLPKQLSLLNTAETSIPQKSLCLTPVQQEAIPPGSNSPSSNAQASCGVTDLAPTSTYYQTVLQESRDLILAVSLKGTLFYVSPSCKDMVGYDEEELVNQNISKLCHPSDLTGILRQLKLIGNTPHTPIDLVFRAVDRQGEVFWMESQGQLHVEVGKGRKYLVVVGRPRKIGPLSWQSIRSAGGLGENEFWMKLSLDGLCLFATSPVRDILSFEPAEMVGKSLTQMCATEERGPIIDAIRAAYEGNDVVTLVYSLKDRNGGLVSVVSDFHPPHYSSGPRACGSPLPASKQIYPPSIIFCQTNSLSSASKRPEKQPRTRDGFSSGDKQASDRALVESDTPTNQSTDPVNRVLPTSNSVFSENPADPPSTIIHTAESSDGYSDDDLFSALGTNKTTPWNYEFSQLKRQNLKLRSELSQRGLSRHLTTTKTSSAHVPSHSNKEQQQQGGCTRNKNSQGARLAASHAPYPSRPHLHSTPNTIIDQPSPEVLLQPDPSSFTLDSSFGFDQLQSSGFPLHHYHQSQFLSAGDQNSTSTE